MPNGSANTTASDADHRSGGKSADLRRTIVDVLVAVGLLLTLGAVCVFDKTMAVVATVPPPVVLPPTEPSAEPEPALEPPAAELPEETLPPIDPERRLRVEHRADLRFGLCTTTGNPDDPSDDHKRLIYAKDGGTNNTRLWVDGATPLVGGGAGSLVTAMHEADGGRLEADWEYRGIRVTQTIQYVAGDTSRRIDTIRVDYRLKNTGTAEPEVGLRVMLDSLIGDNDGVPFIVPGREQLVTEPAIFREPEVPDFIRALERPDLVNPGVVADLGLRPEPGERPSEVILTNWPGSDAEWDYNRTRPFGSDTAIGLYYSPRKLLPGGERLISFTYGLGSISSTRTRNASLSLTAGGPFRSGGKFWLVCLVKNPRAGQEVRLELPSGLELGPNETATKPVQAGTEFTQLSWLVKILPTTLGASKLKALLLPESVSEEQEVNVQPRDPRLVVRIRQPVRTGKPFWVSVLVQHSRAGQTLELRLPTGCKFGASHTARKSVPVKEGYAQVDWLVESSVQGGSQADLSVVLTPDGLEEKVTVPIQTGSLID